MTVLEIPSNSETTEYRQITSLDGTAYALDFSWSERSQGWYLSVSIQRDGEEPTPIVLGQRLSIGWPILIGCVVDGRPLGEIFADAADGGDAGRSDLGSRVRVLYFDAAEMGRASA